MSTTYYELGDLLAVATCAAVVAYLAGRAHAERAAHRARLKRRAYRHHPNNRHNQHKGE